MNNKSTMELLIDIVAALEKKFPGHNGPFHYASRLGEETGELAQEVMATSYDEQHFLKEAQDVMRVCTGIAVLYDVQNRLPREFEAQKPNATPAELVAKLCIASGKVADAINHAEGTGIKNEKHGHEAGKRIRLALEELTEAVGTILAWRSAYEGFGQSVQDFHQRYRKDGFIASS